MSRNSLSALPDYNNCLVNLSNSILKKFGARTTAGTLPLADKYLEGEYRNVVLLVLDALGTSIVEKHLERNGFFRSHMAGALDSVYPPTTVAATVVGGYTESSVPTIWLLKNPFFSRCRSTIGIPIF